MTDRGPAGEEKLDRVRQDIREAKDAAEKARLSDPEPQPAGREPEGEAGEPASTD
jgi:hypothetical protein